MPDLSRIFRHDFFAVLAFLRSFLAAQRVKSRHDRMESSHGIIGWNASVNALVNRFTSLQESIKQSARQAREALA